MLTRANNSHSLSIRNWIAAIPIAIIGLTVFAYGIHLETINPKTNLEADFACRVLALGTGTAAAGFALPFLRLRFVAIIALAAPLVAFTLAGYAFWVLILLNAVFHLGL
jgi:hypothetical protein